MMRGTGEWRARPTAAEPITRWAAWDELPTMMTTVSPGLASWMAVAAATSSSVMMPWRRSNLQSAPLASSYSAAWVRSCSSISSKSRSISAMAPGDSMARLDSWAT